MHRFVAPKRYHPLLTLKFIVRSYHPIDRSHFRHMPLAQAIAPATNVFVYGRSLYKNKILTGLAAYSRPRCEKRSSVDKRFCDGGARGHDGRFERVRVVSEQPFPALKCSSPHLCARRRSLIHQAALDSTTGCQWSSESWCLRYK